MCANAYRTGLQSARRAADTPVPHNVTVGARQGLGDAVPLAWLASGERLSISTLFGGLFVFAAVAENEGSGQWVTAPPVAADALNWKLTATHDF
jgi:hypothetical protein